MKKAVLFILFFFLTGFAYAGVVVDQPDNRLFFGNKIEYYVDKDDLDFSEIVQQESGWQHSELKSLSFGYTTLTYWVRFDLENRIDQKLFLTFNLINTDLINLYIVNEDGTYTEKTGGIQYPFNHREVHDKNIFFVIPEYKGEKTIYVRFESHYVLSLMPEIVAGDKRLDRVFYEYLPAVLSHGIYLALLIYHLLLYISSKEKSYLFLAFLIVSFQMYELAHDGLGYMFLWPGSPFFESLVIPLSMGLMGIALGYFILLSIEAKKNFKKIHRVLLFFILLGVILCFLSVSGFRQFSMKYTIFYATVATLVTSVLLFYAGVIKKNRAAFFLFLGYFLSEISNGLAIATCIPELVKQFPFLNDYVFILTICNYTRVLFILIFSFVVADRINMMKKTLKMSEETYRSIFNGTSDAICIYDKETLVVSDANQPMLDLFKMSLDEVRGKRPAHFSAVDDGHINQKAYEIYKKTVEYGRVQTEWLFKKSTGEKFWGDVTINDVYINGEDMFMFVIRDISERKRAEEEKEKIMRQLTQAQKMEAVGSLAGGLAHDFNNILTGILGSSNVAKASLDRNKFDRQKIEKYLNIIEEMSIKASGMVKQLLTITKKHEFKFVPANLNRILMNVVQVCLNSFPKSVRIETSYLQDPAMVNADVAGLEQVFLNIFVNASHALTIMREPSEPEGGMISLKIQQQYADDIFCRTYQDAQKGANYFSVSIEDNGCGIDQDKLERIFDPFFTTKSETSGSGLGLSMVYSVINRHKGLMKVYSEKGKGTMFLIYIPEDASADKTEAEDMGAVVKWHGRILIIDDEDFVRQIAKDILTDSGYDIITAENGTEGIDIYQKNASDINLVLLDMSMPGISGLDTYRELKKINPHIKVIMSSGFSMDERVRKAFENGVDSFIQKPYTNIQLSKAVYDVLVSDRT